MTPEAWARVKTILAEALDLQPEKRNDYLATACAGEPSLRSEVESLLAANGDDWEFFDAPPAIRLPDMEAAAAPSRVGERIGAYELVSELGRGGMGMVYLARRADDQFQKKVAIKLIRPGMASGFALERFRSERQISASLEHPHIARLLDGGATSNGEPFFVLEYVEGEPLIEYCDRRRMPLAERLRLFSKVCAAVQYAHQNLVVHRDIKPGNILVTAQGTPKLLDFGIAKLLNPEGVPEAAETGTLFRMLTPDYASPEQIRGERITTASDIYALGVVLYELLAGRKPYHVTGNEPGELLRVVCERDPEKPSAKAKSRELEGDLDAIVLKAMRKEPERRYASVGELAADLRRHQTGVPVLARRGTFSYRAAKFARRHRVILAAAAVVAVALAGGVVATLREARRAREAEARAQRRFNDVRRMANSFLFELHDAIRDLPGSTPARHMLVERALQYLDGLSREATDDRTLKRELAEAYQRVGDVQGNPYHANLGDMKGGLDSYGKAIALLEPAVASGGSTDDERASLATAYLVRGGMELVAGHAPAAIALSRKGLALREALAMDSPGDGRRQMELAQAWQFLAYNLNAAGQGEEAADALRRQAAILEERQRAEPGSPIVRRAVEQNRYVIGESALRSERWEDALGAFREAAALLEELRREDPANVVYLRDLAYASMQIGSAEAGRGDARTALDEYRRAQELFGQLAAADRKSVDGVLGVAITRHNVGETLSRVGRRSEALAEFRAARPGYEAVLKGAPSNMWVAGMLGTLYFQLAEFETGGSDPACALYRRSLALFEQVAAAGSLSEDRRKSFLESKARTALCGAAGSAR